MLKKVATVTVLSTLFLFGGVIHNDVSASVSMNGADKGQSLENGEGYSDRYNFFKDYLTHYYGNWFLINQDKQGDDEETDESARPDETDKTDDRKTNDDQSADKPKEHKDSGEADNENETGQTPAEEQTQAEENTVDEQTQTDESSDLKAFEQEVIDLTNQERTSRGLQPLQADSELSAVARDKSVDMLSNGYFSHNSPTYGSPFDMMDAYQINYRTAGENIAHGQRTPEEVVNGWMNSEGHRKNILKPDFTHIGVGYTEQGNYWTQHFIGK